MAKSKKSGKSPPLLEGLERQIMKLTVRGRKGDAQAVSELGLITLGLLAIEKTYRKQRSKGGPRRFRRNRDHLAIALAIKELAGRADWDDMVDTLAARVELGSRIEDRENSPYPLVKNRRTLKKILDKNRFFIELVAGKLRKESATVTILEAVSRRRVRCRAAVGGRPHGAAVCDATVGGVDV